MNDAPIFIVGCPRSGTTLLRDLLRSHPRLTFPPESHFLPAFYRGYGDPRSEREAVALARRILRLEWIRLWRLPLTAAEFAADRSFRDVLVRLYGAWAGREHKARWGDKTPHYVTAIPTLREIFPAGQIIHIVRDGRDVALSWLRTGLEPRNLFVAARLWKQYVSAGRAAGVGLPRAAYLEVRYEALLSAPADTRRAPKFSRAMPPNGGRRWPGRTARYSKRWREIYWRRSATRRKESRAGSASRRSVPGNCTINSGGRPPG
jgi:hypothetical protein